MGVARGRYRAGGERDADRTANYWRSLRASLIEANLIISKRRNCVSIAHVSHPSCESARISSPCAHVAGMRSGKQAQRRPGAIRLAEDVGNVV